MIGREEQLGVATEEQPYIDGRLLSVIVESQLADKPGLQQIYDALPAGERLVLDTIAKKVSKGDLALQGVITRSLLMAQNINPDSVTSWQESLKSFSEAFESRVTEES